MKNKIIIIILSLLFLTSTSLGIFGLVLKSKIPTNNPKPGQNSQKDAITYTYYLENEKLLKKLIFSWQNNGISLL